MLARGMTKRVRNEVELHRRLAHPAILKMWDFFEVNTTSARQKKRREALYTGPFTHGAPPHTHTPVPRTYTLMGASLVDTFRSLPGWQDARFVYLVLEIAEGGDVTEAFGGEALPEPDAARLMLQVVDAVGYLHQRGITHRVRI